MTAKTCLHTPEAFFSAVRQTTFLGPTLSADEVTGLNEDLEACGSLGFPVSWTAYCIATDYHETAGTMRPIKEYGRGHGHAYGRPGAHGQVAYGRGKVQLTWDFNYEKADVELAAAGLIKPGELLANYDLALRPDLASFIMAVGMRDGWFTAKKLDDFLPTDRPANRSQLESARRIINGQDRMALIAGYALDIQAALISGDWR